MRQALILLSPIAVILVYWGFIFVVVMFGVGTSAIKRWIATPTGSWPWSDLALLLALPALTFRLHYPDVGQ